MSEPPLTLGLHHFGLTVPDLAASRDFFISALGFRQIGEKPDYPAVFVSDGTTTVTLWQASDPATAVPFDRKANIGLHHFALRVDGAAALDAAYARLNKTPGVDIEFAPEPLGGGPTRHMMCFIPGGIRMELIAPAG